METDLFVHFAEIAVNRYGVEDRTLWLSCAVAAVAVWVIAVFGLNRTADLRAFNREPEPIDRFFPVVGLPLHLVIVGSLILVIVGVWPGAEEALYVTALTSGVIFGGYTLLVTVLSQRHQSGAEREEP